MPIPLRPQRLLLVGEVESIDDVAPLPAAVAWRLRAELRVSPVRDVTQPDAGGIDRIDMECQRPRPQTAPGDSSPDTTRATRRARPRAINSSGFGDETDQESKSRSAVRGAPPSMTAMDITIHASFLPHGDADVVQEPTDQPYGVRDCAFREPAGTLIRIQELR